MDIEDENEETIYRAIMDRLETEFGQNVRNITVEVEEDGLTVEGAVPSSEVDEELHRIIFEALELDEVHYDVIIDEDLQSNMDDPYRDDLEQEGRLDGVNNTGNDNLSQSPRQQF